MSEVTVKKFVVIPRDAFDLLTRRYSTLAEATSVASEACAESGMATMVVELKAVASRADRPVTVRKV